MSQRYIEILQSTSLETLLTLPHKHVGVSPSGFVVRTDTSVPSFPFSLCPLQIVPSQHPIDEGNPHDVIVEYDSKQGDLESLLYKLWELYRSKHLEKTLSSSKRYLKRGHLPPRKIIIPCFGRQENLVCVLKRFQQIDLPEEGYRPLLCIVEHSPYPSFDLLANEFGCEYLWIFLDPRTPDLPIGQFNKALCYDKAFLHTSPAEWYLFHDNDVLVPRDFWARIDANVARTNTNFLQPYTGRCLMNTLPEIAERLRANLSLVDEGLLPEMISPRTPGAPGGSLYLKRQRYIDVGGHDPNTCWGYGPEDQLFFDKLKFFEPIAYADEPPIEMVHLWHPTAQNNNLFRHEMDWFVKVFLRSKSSEEWKGMMEGKKHLLLHLLQKLEKEGYSSHSET